MQNRIFKKAALACIAMAVASYAQCNKTVLYGKDLPGRMEETTRTFPEAPEWVANWGDFENMPHPYIRLSGQKSLAGDWTGALLFNETPTLNGDTLSLTVRSTQKGKFGVWLSGDFGTGKVHFEQIEANRTYAFSIPVAQIATDKSFKMQKLWIGLFGVPVYQYTTLFINNIAVTGHGKCSTTNATNSNGGAINKTDDSTNGTATNESKTPYIFLGADINSSNRKLLVDNQFHEDPYGVYSDSERTELRKTTNLPFIIDEAQHEQIMEGLASDSLTPKESRNIWYKAMYFVYRGRTRDSVIAAPNLLYENANVLAAAYGMKTLPLLVTNLDYGYKICQDTLCKNTTIEPHHLLMAGLPSSYSKGSKISIVYDPYFVATTENTLPKIEVCLYGKCQALAPKSSVDLEFNSAGVQKLVIKLDYGTTHIQQTLSMEVK